ncbi:MAG: hypothetical protein V4499_04445 [Pseudomonadota bacterium]
MNGTGNRMGWGARLLIAVVFIIVGAGAAIWGLAHYPPAARVLGVVPAAPQPVITTPKTAVPPPSPAAAPVVPDNARIAELERRLSAVENATQRAEGFAGRADALVVAFAARRAIDRGVALGFLENLLVDRFGAQHQAAVATIVTASHQPVRLEDLTSEYESLGPQLRSGGPEDSWWTNFKREMGSIIEIHRADQPPVNAEARYNRALQRLSMGDVDQALAETMRMPGAARASDWVAKARRYVAAHRALDEIESAALLTGPGNGR